MLRRVSVAPRSSLMTLPTLHVQLQSAKLFERMDEFVRKESRARLLEAFRLGEMINTVGRCCDRISINVYPLNVHDYVQPPSMNQAIRSF